MFNKNRSLINTLPVDKRCKAVSGFANWVAPLGLEAAKKAFRSGKLVKAFRLRQRSKYYQMMA